MLHKSSSCNLKCTSETIWLQILVTHHMGAVNNDKHMAHLKINPDEEKYTHVPSINKSQNCTTHMKRNPDEENVQANTCTIISI